MRTPAEVRTRIQTMWSRQWVDWACGGGTWPLALTLHPPSQSEALKAWDRFGSWRQSWEGQHSAKVETIARKWTGLGTQLVPNQIVFASAHEVATFLGNDQARKFELAFHRWHGMSQLMSPDADLSRLVPWLAQASETDVDRATRVAQWLHAHPRSGLYVRQIPVPGVDTKWVEQNRSVVAALLLALRGDTVVGRFEALAGLREERPKCRFRILDPELRNAFAGLADISTPIDDLMERSPPAHVVLIVENLQTFLAFPDLPGTIVFFGSGFQAVSLAAIPWLQVVRSIYWGDLDAAGFEILSALRGVLPNVESFGMDETTLLEHRAYWVADPKQRVVELAHLSAGEQSVYHSLADGRHGQGAIRLEQERISWAHIWPAVEAAILAGPATKSSESPD